MTSPQSPVFQSPNSEQSFLLPLLGSALFHILLFFVWISFDKYDDYSLAVDKIMVSFVDDPTAIKKTSGKNKIKQIVIEPNSSTDILPEKKIEPHLLAEKNHSTAIEQIARGNGLDSALGVTSRESPPIKELDKRRLTKKQKEKIKPVSQAVPSKPNISHQSARDRDNFRSEYIKLNVEKKERSNSTDLKLQLKLDSKDALSKFGSAEVSSSSDRKVDSSSNRRPRASSKSGAASASKASERIDALLSSSGGIGSADNLSGIRDGVVTLLNTKADTYAVFVRRVAYRVFGTLRETGWQRLAAQHIRAIARPVIVIADLTADGELISVSIRQPSGSGQFDALLVAAVNRSVSDPNPPKGATAADGRIRFIFQSRSTVSIGPTGPQGIPSERRWIELGTGLD